MGLIRRTLIVAGVAFAALGGVIAGGAEGASTATLYVDNTNAQATNTGNNCQTQSTPCLTISHAVSVADVMGSTATTIDVLAGAYDEAVTITNEPTLTITGGPGVTVTAPVGDSIFTATSPTGKVTLSNLTITGAKASGNGGGVEDDFVGVNLINDTFSNDSAGSGGALDTEGGNTIVGDTFVDDSSSFSGGAISNGGMITAMNDDTFVNNAAGGDGGAIFTVDESVIENDTFSGNTAAGSGGALYNEFDATIAADIFDDGSGPGSNCVDAPVNGGSGVTDVGYNLADNSDCMSTGKHDIVNVSETGTGGINLDALGSNGGPTQTMALGAGSAAIDHIPFSTGLCPSTDQRGFLRPDDGESACDVGSYESGSGPPVTLTVVTAGSGRGTVTSSPAGIDCSPICSRSFSEGTALTLTATPAAGSIFTGWSGAGCSGTGACQVTMSAAESVTATFDPIPTDMLAVSKSGTGSGSVKSSPAGIDCGSTCSASFTQGTVVTLTATPAAGSTFTGWSGGNCSGTSACKVTLGADTTVTATFTRLPPPPVTLTVVRAGSGGGTVTSSPAGIDCGSACSASFGEGTVVTLTATPAAGSTFTGWSGGGCSGTGACHVTLGSDTTVTATFTRLAAPPVTLTVVRAGSGSGTVTSGPAGIDCGSSCSASFGDGTVVTLTATPAGQSRFEGWSGACATASTTCTVTLGADSSVTATFVALPTISRLSVSPRTFKAAAHDPSTLPLKHRSKLGTVVSYILNQAATVRFNVERLLPGRAVKRGTHVRCVALARHKNHKGPPCTRTVVLRGSFRVNGTAGKNAFRFTGRLAGKELARGSYVLVASPSADGIAGSNVKITFRVGS